MVTNPAALSGHMIVFPGQSFATLDSFLLAMREVRQEEWTDIVVLSPNVTAALWQRIHMFPRVYWFAGTPLSHSDLLKVRVGRAKSVIIMADPSPAGDEGGGWALPLPCVQTLWRAPDKLRR